MNYVFAIGGTGARCLESLIYLCAMGAGPKQITPIIIDADEGNGNVIRTIDVIKKYKLIRDRLSDVKSGCLFHTKINYDENNFINPLDYLDEEEPNLRNFYNYDILPDDLKLFASCLFSKPELDMKLNLGFRGIPSIGSVIMDNIQYEKIFEPILERFHQEDEHKAFIFSSIFGGTGASGYPVISKILKTINNECGIAGCILLPYFKFNRIKNSDEIEPDSNAFTYNTIGALPFYYKYIDNDTNYVIGDYVEDNFYKSSTGGNEQKNNAHFIEFISSLSFLHYIYDWEKNCPKFQALQVSRSEEPRNMDIMMGDLPLKLKNMDIEKCIEKFGIFVSFYTDLIDAYEYKEFDQISWINNNGLTKKVIQKNNDHFTKVNEFLDNFIEWYEQVSTNEASALKLFNIFKIENLLYSNPEKYRKFKNYEIDKYIINLKNKKTEPLDICINLIDRGIESFIKKEGE